MTECVVSGCKQHTSGFKVCAVCRQKGKDYKKKRKQTFVPDGFALCNGCLHLFKKNKYKSCTKCRAKKRKRYGQVQAAPAGHKCCNRCLKVKLESNFVSRVARVKVLTKTCLQCRELVSRAHNNPKNSVGVCKVVYAEWRDRQRCKQCNTSEAIEADHLNRKEKIHNCSDAMYWSTHGGPTALQNELLKCQPLCSICHRMKTYGNSSSLTKSLKRKYINRYKLRIGKCKMCERTVTTQNTCCFDFDHLDSDLKLCGISKMVNYPSDKFYALVDAEIAKCQVSYLKP